jgi:hypothetical protein
MPEIVARVRTAPTDARRDDVAYGRTAGGFSFHVEAQTSEGMEKYAEMWLERDGAQWSTRWSIRCDEPAPIGADTAPSPLHYFTAAIAF